MTDSASKMQTIRALLRQAEDPAATAAEAESFRAKAFELMAQHGIEMAVLEAETDEAYGSATHPEQRIFRIDPPWALNGVRLLHGLAIRLRCKAIRITGGKKNKGEVVEVFGFESDINRLDVIFTSLLLQMHTGLASAQKEKRHDEHGRAFNQSWMQGFINVVVSRVAQAEHAARKEAESESGTGTELVLAGREAKVQAAYEEAHPATHKVGVRSTGSGYGSGAAAGRRADIGQTKVKGRNSLPR